MALSRRSWTYFIQAYSRLGPSKRAGIAAAWTVALMWFGAIAEDGVQQLLSDDPGALKNGILWTAALALLALVVYLIQVSVLASREFEQRVFQSARQRLADLNLEHLAECDALVQPEDTSGLAPNNRARKALICDSERIQKVVSAIWETVDSFHNVSTAETDRLNFEVTVIARSLRTQALTIPAWRNRDRRKPRSLTAQEEGQIDIYDRTEAAKMIASKEPKTRVISDTSARGADYNSLYDGQKTRIRSSVLHPVLSPAGDVLAVVVLHCEREKFFREEDTRYWHELFTLFSPLVALELEKISAYNRICRSSVLELKERYIPY